MSTCQETSQNIEERLESIIDTYGLGAVLETIGVICYDKAEHLRSNWQDDFRANDWARAAQVILTASNKIDI